MKLVDFANKAGFELKEGFYIKESNGYNLMLVEYQQGYVRFMSALVFLEREVSKEELKRIQNNTQSKKIRYADGKSKNILLFLLDDLYGFVKEEKIDKAIEKLFNFTKALEQTNLKNQSKCIFCGQLKEDEELIYGNYNGLYLPQHVSCRENAKNNAIKKMNNENANKQMYPISVLLGFAAALVVSVIINVLEYYVFDGTMYSLLYTAVPIATFFAYKLGKAPKNKNMIICVIAASVLATILSNIIFYALFASANNMTFAAFFDLNKAAILKDNGIRLLFLAIGTWISWGIISKTNDRDVNKF